MTKTTGKQQLAGTKLVLFSSDVCRGFGSELLWGSNLPSEADVFFDDEATFPDVGLPLPRSSETRISVQCICRAGVD